MVQRVMNQQRKFGSSDDCISIAKKISYTTFEFGSVRYQNLNRHEHTHTHTHMVRFKIENMNEMLWCIELNTIKLKVMFQSICI